MKETVRDGKEVGCLGLEVCYFVDSIIRLEKVQNIYWL